MPNLYSYQLDVAKRALKHDSYGLFMDTGTGKTATGIAIMKHYEAMYQRMLKRNFRVLVVCPLSIIESVWMDELGVWFPQAIKQNLWKALKRKKNNPSAHIHIVNFESATRLKDSFVKSMDAVFLDESSKLKNPKAKITKFMHALKPFVKHWYPMSGSPAPNNLLEYWSQMYLVNPNILGDNFYRFRARYFYTVGYNGFTWLPNNDFKRDIGKILAKQSFALDKKDCLDLPPTTMTHRTFDMEPKQYKAYKEMQTLNISMIRDAETDRFGAPVVGVNELAKIMKLRQITAGFAVNEDGKEVEVSRKKLNLLKEVLDELGNEQVIIWCQFHWEIRQIQKILGDKSCGLHGMGLSQEDKESSIKNFKSGSKQYLIAHPKTGAHGHTFVNSRYSVYFSLSYSYEEEKQSKDRQDRIGQTHKVTYIYLIANGTVDQTMYKAIRLKQNVSQAVLREIHDNA